MLERWKLLSYSTRFSIVSCAIMIMLGFLGMGITGALMYYPVSMFLGGFPHIDEFHGDWVWPAMLMISFLFPIGFIFGGLAWHYLKGKISSLFIKRSIYTLIVWLWAAFLWYVTLDINSSKF